MAQATAKKDEHEHQTEVTDNPYSREVAQFVSGLTYDKIPARSTRSHQAADTRLHRLRHLRLDQGAQPARGQRRSAVVDSNGKCGIWGTNKRMSAPHAALLNGTFIQGFEIDDIHRKGAMHIGSTTLPAITAIAEIRPGMSGKRYLTAAVAGYEIGPRVGICESTLLGDGWHSGAVIGVFSGAASAASAMGLYEEQTLDALGIAGTMACGFDGGAVRLHGQAHAARPRRPERLYGALARVSGIHRNQERVRKRIRRLLHDVLALQGPLQHRRNSPTGWASAGKPCWIRSSFIPPRRAITRRWMRSASCANVTRLPSTSSTAVVVHGSQVTKDHVFWKYEPSGMTNAQFCMPYVVATLLLEGDFFVDQVTEDKMADPERIALSRKIEFIAEPEITKMGLRYYVRVEIFLKDGTRMEETVEAQRGSETKFASEADVVDKFEKLVKHVFPDAAGRSDPRCDTGPGQAGRRGQARQTADRKVS